MCKSKYESKTLNIVVKSWSLHLSISKWNIAFAVGVGLFFRTLSSWDDNKR